MTESENSRYRLTVGSPTFDNAVANINTARNSAMEKIRALRERDIAAVMLLAKTDPGVLDDLRRFNELQQEGGCESDSMN